MSEDEAARVLTCPDEACRWVNRCLGGLPCSHLPQFARRPPVVVPHRPPVEKYTRCSVQTTTHCVEPAVEWRAGDVFDDIVSLLEGLSRFRISAWTGQDPQEMAEAIATSIALLWPGRAFFVEVWQEGRAGFAQAVQQYPMPEAPR